MSRSKHGSKQPRSIRQKKILDIAAEDPDATLDEIADEVPSASTDHVDRVLDQYGDPAANESAEADASSEDHGAVATDSNSMSDSDPQDDDPAATKQPDTPNAIEKASDTTEGKSANQADEAVAESSIQAESNGFVTNDQEPSAIKESESGTDSGGSKAAEGEEPLPSPDELTQKERETLRAILYEPDATQKQVAEMLSISRATVSNRVNAISGFDWSKRKAFVDEVFDGDLTVDSQRDPDPAEESSQATETQALTDGIPEAASGEFSGIPDPEAAPNSSGAGDGTIISTSKRSGSDDDGVGDTENTPSHGSEGLSHEIEAVSQRLATIEQEVTKGPEADDNSPFDDTEIVHKIVYACMNSTRVSEEEELRILEQLMG